MKYSGKADKSKQLKPENQLDTFSTTALHAHPLTHTHPASESEWCSDLVAYEVHCLANTYRDFREHKLFIQPLGKKSCFKYHNLVVICNLL